MGHDSEWLYLPITDAGEAWHVRHGKPGFLKLIEGLSVLCWVVTIFTVQCGCLWKVGTDA